jgi:hypothetical protein
MLVVTVCGCTERDASGDMNLIADVGALRKSDRRSQIDITELAAKYFPVGTARTAAETEFNRLGFTAYSTRSESTGDSWMYVKNLRRSFLGFHDEIRVILTYNDNRVSDVRARLFFHSL